MMRPPFAHYAARNDTWEVRDLLRSVIDNIPTETAAENIASEMNNAYRRGYEAARDEIKSVLGIR